MVLLLTLPVLAVGALAVRLSVGSPVLFRQRRVGLDGREFDILKLRTMSGTPTDGEADSDWAREQLGEQDGSVELRPDRATRVGRFLRALSIDELPQLLTCWPARCRWWGRDPSAATTSACSRRRCTATETATASSPGSPAGRR